MRIVQLLGGAQAADAITREALSIQRYCTRQGLDTLLFADPKHTQMSLRKLFKDYQLYKEEPADLVLYHYGIDSPVTDFLAKLQAKRVLRYHNITPARYFRGVNDEVASKLQRGRQRLRELLQHVDLCLADSSFNAEEIQQWGFSPTQVVPLVVDLEFYQAAPQREVLRQLQDGKVNLLFVGRVVPNKRIEDLLHLFYYYHRYLNSNSRLLIVGSVHYAYLYYCWLRELAQKYNLRHAYFTDQVTEAALMAHYQVAHVFLSLSEHEGFCLPLVEAMYFNLPIIARASTAIPSTLGNAGILVSEPNPALLAEFIDYLLHSLPLQTRLQQRSKERLLELAPENTLKRLLHCIREL